MRLSKAFPASGTRGLGGPRSGPCGNRVSANILPFMPDSAIEQVRESLDAIYHAESGRILATLIRLLGDFDLAEDALHDAFAAALERWPQDGVPANPRAWLISTGRFKAIDALRRRTRLDASEDKIAEQLETESSNSAE